MLCFLCANDYHAEVILTNNASYAFCVQMIIMQR